MKPKPDRCLTVLVLLMCLCSLAQAQFTLEQVLSSPFPSDLVGSKKGDRIAWVFDHQGKRNIWYAEGPSWRSRQLTTYDKDDGQEISDLVFSPNGDWIAYVRGGPPNAEKEIPNPTSDPAGARQEIWLLNVRTRAAVKIGEGSAPTFFPKGDRILFFRDDTLWFSTFGGGKPKKLFIIRGRISSPLWSPDGSQLVFSSERGDHNFITTYDIKSHRLRFIQPGVDRDVNPRWSPDGKQIAFIRLLNVADTFSADRERITPWAIWVVDAASGEGKQVWRSGETELDSYSGRFGENILQWAGNDRLVFGSEHTGWAHLYSLLIEVGEVTALTSGAYEVETIAWPEDRSFVVVASNFGDIDRRHLWKINVSTGFTQQITAGEGIEMYPVVLAGGKRVAFCRSTASEPLTPWIALMDGTNLKRLTSETLSKQFPSRELVAPQPIIFRAADGTEIHGQLFTPKKAEGKMPGVVFMHGGPARQMLLGWHYMYYYHNSYAFNQYLASKGYAVLSVNFRSGIGYGRAFREAKHRGPRGASEYQDVIAAAKYLRSLTYVDSTKIGLWGGSYGGYLTALGLARNSDIFSAGVDLHGVHDWSARVGRTPWATGELMKLGKESSPISFVDMWKSPVLLIHGDDDRNVAFSQTVELVKKLREKKVEYEQLIFPDEVHDFLRHEHWLQAYHAAEAFLNKYLMNGKKMSVTH